MIVVDIETTSLDRNTAQMINIGAVHLDTGNELELECYPEPSATPYFDDLTTQIHGVTRKNWFGRLATGDFVSQAYAVDRFIDFCVKNEDKPVLYGQNIGGFDCMILHRIYDGTFDMSWKLGHRFVDIHSMACLQTGRSMSSKEIAEYLKLEPEQKIHTGISGARYEAKAIDKLFEIQAHLMAESLKNVLRD